MSSVVDTDPVRGKGLGLVASGTHHHDAPASTCSECVGQADLAVVAGMVVGHAHHVDTGVGKDVERARRGPEVEAVAVRLQLLGVASTTPGDRGLQVEHRHVGATQGARDRTEGTARASQQLADLCLEVHVAGEGDGDPPGERRRRLVSRGVGIGRASPAVPERRRAASGEHQRERRRHHCHAASRPTAHTGDCARRLVTRRHSRPPAIRWTPLDRGWILSGWGRCRGPTSLPAPAGSSSTRSTSCTTAQAGPSLRTLARQTGVSHTTVSKVLSSSSLPSWGNVELIAEALGGDVPHIHSLWLSASAPADGASAAAGRIAGRIGELAAVRSHLDTGAGMLLVTGEAGIGKTTLVAAAAAASQPVVAVGHCLRLSSEVPLLPVIDALRGLHQADDGQWMGEALTTCPPYVPSAHSLKTDPLHRPGTSPTLADPDDDWPGTRLFAVDLLGALESLAAKRGPRPSSWRISIGPIPHDPGRARTPGSRAACWLPDAALGASSREDSSRGSDASGSNRIRRSTRGHGAPPRAAQPRRRQGEQLRLLGGVGSIQGLGRPDPRTQPGPTPFHRTARGARTSLSETELPDMLADLPRPPVRATSPRPAWVIARTLGVADRGLSIDVLRACVDLDTEGLAAALTELGLAHAPRVAAC